MNITLENAMVYIGIITFAMTLAKMLVITPLKDAISRLEVAIEKLGAQLARIDERVDKQSERIAVVERDVKSAHRRIDDIMETH
ncbi:hypothetical protein [Cloacibacillus sp.]|uniref:hypothetical protein n=1 Tax=Cloacibacillus sp. TaxID=2049023 RepID=UPI0025BEF7C6|nr:hypothetical protein [Cloacibacillus sp.]MCC8056451.1 hypothetical protein [Cloacibacillus sp.]